MQEHGKTELARSMSDASINEIKLRREEKMIASARGILKGRRRLSQRAGCRREGDRLR